MFTVYKKIISPESSPVLGPAIAPKEALANDGPTPSDRNNNNNNNNNDKSASVEPFSLCNYCCSPRTTKGKAEQDQMKGPTPMQEPECKYEFGHATHYTYRATTPRLICEFETGTPVAP
jgi:hypothetical protein